MADLTHDSADDAFHEIQLSGKQLVFLFMATTVVSVVIFLCGVLVGRGVRAEEIAADPPLAAAKEAPPASESLPPEPLATEPPSPPAGDQLSYTKRLESEKPVSEQLKPRVEESTPRVEASAAPADVSPRVPETPAPTRESEPAVAPPSGQGARPGTWAVQVVSLRDRGAASQLVQRLRNKGYPAFLVAPAAGTPTQLYKVQVGRYSDRSEAQQVETRLKKEEQFETWIVR